MTSRNLSRLSHPVRRWHAVAIGVGLLGFTIAQAVTCPVTAPAFAQVQEKILRTVTVTGHGSERIATTLTQVRLGVEVQGKTAAEVQQQVAERSNAVVKLLRSRQVDRLETTGINLNPNYRYDNGTQTLTGYGASNTVSFRVETPKAGEIMDAAVQAGATRIDGVSFVASDAAIAIAQKTALRTATQDAQAQADTVLSVLGLTRRDVVSIQINGASTPPPRPVPFAAKADAMLAAAPPSPVIGGDQPVEASVTLQISY